MFNEVKYFSNDTIFALATPIGGAICVLRLSGPLTNEIAAKTLKISTAQFEKEILTKRVYRKRLWDFNQKQIDDAVLIRFQNPQSYTGEDLVEIHTHGSQAVVSCLIETLKKYKARQAIAGEFSFRSVRNGKMSILQAQAVSELIQSKNIDATRMALEKLDGHQGQLINELSDKLKNLVTRSELGIDFSDQDIEELSLPVLKLKAKEVVEKLKKLEESFTRGTKIQEGLRAVFVGLPNAGKSSFFNALLGEDRALVSEQAGTTRDVVHEKLNLHGENGSVTLRLEDTAGIRKTEDTIEKKGIEKTVVAIKNADLVLWVIDATRIKEDVQALLDLKTNSGINPEKTVLVFNKEDLIHEEQKSEAKIILEKLKIPTHIFVAAKTGEGVSDSVQSIIHFCEKWIHRDPGEVLLTREDHVFYVKEARKTLEQALQAHEEDLFAADVRHALHALGQIVGETMPEDILTKIFSEFCIGK